MTENHNTEPSYEGKWQLYNQAPACKTQKLPPENQEATTKIDTPGWHLLSEAGRIACTSLLSSKSHTRASR